MTKVKICGLTRAEDAILATQLGADYLGFVFVKESPRYVTPMECGRIAAALKAAALPPRSMVGVFRDQPRDEVERIAAEVGLDVVQLHGTETYTLDLPTIKAFHIDDDTTTDADYVLFDTGGGTGRTFDWNLLKTRRPAKPFFLAGGLTPDNVRDAITIAQPYAIDLASGVERAPGIKDPDKMRKLFERVRNQ